MRKKEFREDAARHYAEINNIALNEESDHYIVEAVRSFVGIQSFKCNECDHYIRTVDTYCWFCGEDVSEHGDGGFDKIAANVNSKKIEKAKKVKKVEVEVKEVEPEIVEDVEDVEDVEPEIVEDAEAEEEPLPVEEEKVVKTRSTSTKIGYKSETNNPPVISKLSKKPRLEVVEGGDLPEVKEEVKEEAKAGTALTLDLRVEEIKKLDSSTGFAAWQIGKHLFEIKEGELYKEKSIKSFADFCEKELSYTRRTAYNYIDIAQKFDPEQAQRLGLFQLLILNQGDLSDRDRNKLAEKATEMTTKELKAKVEEIKEKDREKRGEEPRPERKKAPVNALKSFLGVTVKGKFSKDAPETAVVQLDDGPIGIEVTVMKTGVKITFVELSNETE